MKTLSVIIVSYNTRELTRQCLLALAAALEHIDHEIIVVDNASSDGSAEMVRSTFPGVRAIDNPINAGFGAANNIGIAIAAGEFLLLLNSDAFVERDALNAMLDEMRTRPDVGVVGPRLLNADGSLQRSVFRFPSPLHVVLENLWLARLFARLRIREDFDRWQHDEPRYVPWLIGACLLMRRQAIKAAGVFDERFFMYSEETDWQKRIVDSGYSIYFTPQARVTHLGGASGAHDKPKANGLFFESFDRYVAKHHGRSGLLITHAAMVVGSSLRATLWWTLGHVHRRRRLVAASRSSFHWWLARRQLVTWGTARS